MLHLIRTETGDQGTFGRFFIGGELKLHSLEPPWRDNRSNISCIPKGEYDCIWHRSARFGWCYLVTGVDGRGFILHHSGNYGGDVSKGFRTHTHGCILPGTRRGVLGKQKAVLASRMATRLLFDMMEKKSFKLKIVEVW